MSRRIILEEALKILKEKHGNNIIMKNYYSMRDDAEFECLICGNKWTVKAFSVLNDGTGCSKCRHKSDEITLNDAKKRLFEISGGKIKIIEYKNISSKAKFECNICGYIWETVAYGTINIGNGCSRCRSINMSGENHWNWNGGETDLYFYLRNLTEKWRKKSFSSTNKKCLLTGKRAKIIHHLYPFSDIIKETFNIIRIDIREKKSDYNKDELKIISDNFIRCHNSYGLGIPLSKKIHILFHQIYGIINFTPSDFYEFKEKIESGEIKI